MIPNILSLPKSFGIGNFQITFYALIILTAGLTALFYGMIRFKKMNLDPTRLENVFLVAFPSGLVGARIWYIICQFQTEFKYYFEQSFWTGLGSFIGIKNGHFKGIAGIAVEGGALLGIIVGMLFVHFRRKEMKVFDISDVIVPVILLSQAIGRWGNFFNQEVYGQPTDPSSWSWLGQWFVDQMTVGGQFRTPLFLIESLFNILGFLIILVFTLKPVKEKLHLAPGTTTFAYFVWYGLLRALMEPLRDTRYIMNNSISVTMSWIFFGFGVTGIIMSYVYKLYLRKKFHLHGLDKRVAPNVYLEYCSDNYIDYDFNIVLKPGHTTSKTEDVINYNHDENAAVNILLEGRTKHIPSEGNTVLAAKSKNARPRVTPKVQNPLAHASTKTTKKTQTTKKVETKKKTTSLKEKKKENVGKRVATTKTKKPTK
jgi:phosphatidylglycerol:prolipoprotein diacylglycerol transferase